jgi:hypothetical protein
MRRAVTLPKSRPFARDGRPALPRFIWRSQRAALVSALVAAAAVTLAACGGESGVNLSTAGLAANAAAAAGNGTAGGDTATAGGSAPTVGSTTTVTGGPITSVARIGTGRGFPAAPGAPWTSATESPANLPPAVRTVSCPLSGLQNQAIPAGFKPVAAVRCVPTGGQPTALRMEVATSNLGPLVAALLEPSSSASSLNAVPRCLMPDVDGFPLALVGANGLVIRPSIPVSICGDPSQRVVASLFALHWTTVS